MRARLSDESGQSIITMALMSLFILAILAIVVEASFVYIQRRNLQNDADAAALAGAQALDGSLASATTAKTVATQYANDNISGATIEPVVNDTNTEITVTVHKDAETAFTGWLSFGKPNVTAHAAARIASFNTIRCVVPLGVQQTVYTNATSNYPADPITNPPPLVPLKVAVQSAASGSNTGLVDLGPGNLAGPISAGLGCNLQPLIDTKPGGTIGDVNNGLTDRLKAAKTTGCYTWADVQPPSVTGAATWKCKPENQISKTTGIQQTSVVLLPVLNTDIVQSGHDGYPLAQLGNGQYLLAYFWVSGDNTYDTSGNNWKCLDQQCTIFGRFIVNQPVDLSVYDASKCPGGNIQKCVLDFDPEATTKIVQLTQ
jgi:Flp pilus assembly protein TadG